MITKSRDNIPTIATKVTFYHNGFNYTYHVWKSRPYSTKGYMGTKIPGGWTWCALGNSGEAESQEQAMNLARRWIRESQ